MKKQEAQIKMDKNRDEIDRLLNSELPIDIIKFNIVRLSEQNKRLIKLISKIQ